MTRFRQWLLAVAIAFAALGPMAGAASADPGDPGTTFTASSTQHGRGNGRQPTTTSDPGDPGTTSFTTTSDPGDPGTTY